MQRIYKNQGSLTFKVHTCVDLTGAEGCLLKYRKPDATEGTFPLTIEDELGGILRYNASTGDLDQSGWWTLWAHITFLGGQTAPGEAVRLYVAEEGE